MAVALTVIGPGPGLHCTKCYVKAEQKKCPWVAVGLASIGHFYIQTQIRVLLKTNVINFQEIAAGCICQLGYRIL